MEEITSNEINDLEVEVKQETIAKYITFVSSNLLFGVNVDFVTEIITNLNVTVCPLLPDYIRGIINLRGQIIPVIDIKLRTGSFEKSNLDECCMLIVSINETYMGVLVDAVSQVLDIDELKIAPPSGKNTQPLVNGMISLQDGKTILMLDCELLINS